MDKGGGGEVETGRVQIWDVQEVSIDAEVECEMQRALCKAARGGLGSGPDILGQSISVSFLKNLLYVLRTSTQLIPSRTLLQDITLLYSPS